MLYYYFLIKSARKCEGIVLNSLKWLIFLKPMVTVLFCFKLFYKQVDQKQSMLGLGCNCLFVFTLSLCRTLNNVIVFFCFLFFKRRALWRCVCIVYRSLFPWRLDYYLSVAYFLVITAAGYFSNCVRKSLWFAWLCLHG